MANVIIGIHGLGNKPTKKLLEHWWKLAMIEGLRANNYKTTLPKFELVYWADILHVQPLIYTDDESNPYFLKEKYVKASPNFVAESHETRIKIVDYLGRQLNRIFLNNDYSLNHSFITDTIMNKYFQDLEIYYSESYTGNNNITFKANDLIKARLHKVLEKYKDDEIMLISHSMGSIIAFDVLSFESKKIPVKTFVTMGSPLGLPVVISKIAAEQKRANNNGQNHMITPPSVIGNWYNFSDITDKVAFNYQLGDDFSANSLGVKPIDFLVVNNYENNGERNPHKSYGYLRTPEFSRILNEFIQTEQLTIPEKIVRKTKQIYQRTKAELSLRRGKLSVN